MSVPTLAVVILWAVEMGGAVGEWEVVGVGGGVVCVALVTTVRVLVVTTLGY